MIDAPPSDPGNDHVRLTDASPSVGVTVDGGDGVAATTALPLLLNPVIVAVFDAFRFATRT